MIDFEKLKLAYELAEKLPDTKILIGYSEEDCLKTVYDDVDSLIAKLTELSTPELKYKAGDIVWVVNCEGYVSRHQIDDVLPGNYEPYFINEVRWYREDEIFDTCLELIDTQIKYWTALKDTPGVSIDFKDACDHEYTFLSGFKCAKCGEVSYMREAIAAGEKVIDKYQEALMKLKER